MFIYYLQGNCVRILFIHIHTYIHERKVNNIEIFVYLTIIG